MLNPSCEFTQSGSHWPDIWTQIFVTPETALFCHGRRSYTPSVKRNDCRPSFGSTESVYIHLRLLAEGITKRHHLLCSLRSKEGVQGFRGLAHIYDLGFFCWNPIPLSSVPLTPPPIKKLGLCSPWEALFQTSVKRKAWL